MSLFKIMAMIYPTADCQHLSTHWDFSHDWNVVPCNYLPYTYLPYTYLPYTYLPYTYLLYTCLPYMYNLFSELSYQLVSSDSSSYGRVQVTYDGVAGSVCDPDWTDRDATVLCKQLNFTDGLADS